jgi:hypothetical protein
MADTASTELKSNRGASRDAIGKAATAASSSDFHAY